MREPLERGDRLALAEHGEVRARGVDPFGGFSARTGESVGGAQQLERAGDIRITQLAGEQRREHLASYLVSFEAQVLKFEEQRDRMLAREAKKQELRAS